MLRLVSFLPSHFHSSLAASEWTVVDSDNLNRLISTTNTSMVFRIDESRRLQGVVIEQRKLGISLIET